MEVSFFIAGCPYESSHSFTSANFQKKRLFLSERDAKKVATPLLMLISKKWSPGSFTFLKGGYAQQFWLY